jgi:hypothetical protein
LIRLRKSGEKSGKIPKKFVRNKTIHFFMDYQQFEIWKLGDTNKNCLKILKTFTFINDDLYEII